MLKDLGLEDSSKFHRTFESAGCYDRNEDGRAFAHRWSRKANTLIVHVNRAKDSAGDR